MASDMPFLRLFFASVYSLSIRQIPQESLESGAVARSEVSATVPLPRTDDDVTSDEPDCSNHEDGKFSEVSLFGDQPRGQSHRKVCPRVNRFACVMPAPRAPEGDTNRGVMNAVALQSAVAEDL